MINTSLKILVVNDIAASIGELYRLFAKVRAVLGDNIVDKKILGSRYCLVIGSLVLDIPDSTKASLAVLVLHQADRDIID